MSEPDYDPYGIDAGDIVKFTARDGSVLCYAMVIEKLPDCTVFTYRNGIGRFIPENLRIIKKRSGRFTTLSQYSLLCIADKLVVPDALIKKVCHEDWIHNMWVSADTDEDYRVFDNTLNAFIEVHCK
jgi:hypothetical protein